MHFFVHLIKMKLFIASKERYKLQKALRVKVVFNRVNFEWLVTVNLTSKFVLNSIKKISCKDMEI